MFSQVLSRQPFEDGKAHVLIVDYLPDIWWENYARNIPTGVNVAFLQYSGNAVDVLGANPDMRTVVVQGHCLQDRYQTSPTVGHCQELVLSFGSAGFEGQIIVVSTDLSDEDSSRAVELGASRVMRKLDFCRNPGDLMTGAS